MAILVATEINLLKYSDEPQNTEVYGNLYAVLQSIEKVKAIRNIDELPDLDDKGKAAITYNKSILLENTMKEWSATNKVVLLTKRNGRCQLCHEPIQNVCHIVNNRNHNELKVGSDCIGYFEGLTGYKEMTKAKGEAIKNRSEANRRMEFHNRFANVEQILQTADTYVKQIPIVIPYDLYVNINQTSVRLHQIYAKYVKTGKTPNKSDKHPFELFEANMALYKTHESVVSDFVSKHIDDPLICRANEANWLIQNNYKGIAKQIAQDNGQYTVYTLGYIGESNFIKKYAKLFSQKNHSPVLKIHQYNPTTKEILFATRDLGFDQQLIYQMSIKDFMTNIGCHCILDESYTYSTPNILQYSKINMSFATLTSIINFIFDLVYRIGYAYLIDDETEYLYLCRRGDVAFRRVDIKHFLDYIQDVILTEDDKILQHIIEHISKIKTWQTKDTIEYKKIGDKLNRLYKEQVLDYDRPRLRIKELPLVIYNVEIDATSTKENIIYQRPTFTKVNLKKTTLFSSTYELIDYGLDIYCKTLNSQNDKRVILLMHKTKKLHSNDVGLFYCQGKHWIMRYITTLNEDGDIVETKFESVNNFTFDETVVKSKISVIGKIIGFYDVS